jgi:phosphatidylglycerophosphate synthase
MSDTTQARRPIATRGAAWAQSLAGWLAVRNITPNQISQSSIVFAAVACLSFCLSAWTAPFLFLVIAALAIQMRLIANLMDGLVAVEGGMGTRDGGFWNEVPDRPADVLILAGAGVATGSLALGLAAGIGALMTAYIRSMSTTLGGKDDFSGPMAKQHRMAVMTAAALIGGVEATYSGTHFALFFGLVAVIIGSCVTVGRRSNTLLAHLKRAS